MAKKRGTAKVVRLTKSERALLIGLCNMQFGKIATGHLKPSMRACANRLRERGLLSKKNKAFAEIVSAGRTALQQTPGA